MPRAAINLVFNTGNPVRVGGSYRNVERPREERPGHAVDFQHRVGDVALVLDVQLEARHRFVAVGVGGVHFQRVEAVVNSGLLAVPLRLPAVIAD